MTIKKHILPILYGIFILFFSFESPSLLINELSAKNFEEKDLEEELSEANHFEEEYLKILSSGGKPTLISSASVFECLKINFAPQIQILKNDFAVQSVKITFQLPLYILFCSLKLNYC